MTPTVIPSRVWNLGATAGRSARSGWKILDRGLRQRLIAELGPELEDNIRGGYADWGAMLGFGNLDEDMAIDGVLNGLVVNSVAAIPAGKAFATYTDAKGTKVNLSPFPFVPGPEVNITGIAAHVGTLWENLSFAPMMYAVRSGAPIIQALILMGIYMLLPFWPCVLPL